MLEGLSQQYEDKKRNISAPGFKLNGTPSGGKTTSADLDSANGRGIRHGTDGAVEEKTDDGGMKEKDGEGSSVDGPGNKTLCESEGDKKDASVVDEEQTRQRDSGIGTESQPGSSELGVGKDDGAGDSLPNAQTPQVEGDITGATLKNNDEKEQTNDQSGLTMPAGKEGLSLPLAFVGGDGSEGGDEGSGAAEVPYKPCSPLAADLLQAYTSGTATDLTLKVNGQAFRVHR